MDNILQTVRLRYLSRKANLGIELKEAKEEGRDLSPFQRQIDRLSSLDDTPEAEAQALELYQSIQRAPLAKGYPYLEPEKLDDTPPYFLTKKLLRSSLKKP